ncbi:hypothetical protein BJX65DRAFT_261069 [Aspergillus insuetus]
MDLLHDIIPGYFNSGHTISAPVLFLGQCRKFRQYHGLCGHLVTPVIPMLTWPLVASPQLILTLLLCSSISPRYSFRSLHSCLLSCTLSISLYYSLNFPLNCSFGKVYVRLMIPDQRSSTSGQKRSTARYLIRSTSTSAIWLSVDTIPTFRAINYTNLGRHLLSPRL